MGNQLNEIIQKSSASLFSHSLVTICVYLSWLKRISTLITPPFISFFSLRPSAVARNKAGSLTKAFDLML